MGRENERERLAERKRERDGQRAKESEMGSKAREIWAERKRERGKVIMQRNASERESDSR